MAALDRSVEKRRHKEALDLLHALVPTFRPAEANRPGVAAYSHAAEATL
jgi:hypothetical protein